MSQPRLQANLIVYYIYRERERDVSSYIHRQHTSIFLHICIFVHYMNTNTLMCAHVIECTVIHISCIYTHICIYIYICVCVYVCAYKYIHIYIYTHTYIYVGVIYYTGMHIHPQAFPRRTSATQCSWTPEPCPASTTGAPSQRVSGG